MGGRIVGIGGKPLKTELHHWWPKGLSKLWADVDGTVGRLSWDGKIVRSKPANFGAITNAHHIVLKGPWAGTVEPIFDHVDSNFPYLVQRLAAMRPRRRLFKRKLKSRIIPTPLPEEERQLLGQGIASLIVRSPAYRHFLKKGIQATQSRFGFPDGYKFDSNLLSLTIDQHFPYMESALRIGGKVVLLHTWHREFILGEGYLNDLNGGHHQSAYRCLVPLTPNLAVFMFRDLEYRVAPNCFSVALDANEVEVINCITQIYTKDSILFRTQKPIIESFFAEREFRKMTRHSHEMLDEICQIASGDGPPLTNNRIFG